jgi:hypothetical protein
MDRENDNAHASDKLTTSPMTLSEIAADRMIEM